MNLPLILSNNRITRSTNPDIVFPLVANAAISLNDFVYVNTSGKAVSAISTMPKTAFLAGFALQAAIIGAQVYVKGNGVVSGFTGLVPGSVYYVSAVTAGQISTTKPSGTFNYPIGIAISATQLLIDQKAMGI